MIKLVYCIRKRADMSADKFYDYWLNQHGPKVAGSAKAIGAVKYIQSHPCEPELNQSFVDSRGYLPAYDGITEVWWESLEAMTAAYATPEGIAASQLLAEDEAKFIDFSQSQVFMTKEHEIFNHISTPQQK